MIIIQKHCRKQSRRVEPADYDLIKEIAGEMIELCRKPLGNYPFAFAIAHCQVNLDDPLCFFVTNDGRVIINPIIVGWGEKTIIEAEGCYSYAFRPTKKMKRWSKVFVDYQYMSPNGEVQQERAKVFEGDWARVFQHEIEHFKGMAIY